MRTIDLTRFSEKSLAMKDGCMEAMPDYSINDCGGYCPSCGECFEYGNWCPLAFIRTFDAWWDRTEDYPDGFDIYLPDGTFISTDRGFDDD